MSFSSKEFVNVNKTLLLLRKIFLFLPERIKAGWQRRKIGNLVNLSSKYCKKQILILFQ
jgi:hypothetical protein